MTEVRLSLDPETVGKARHVATVTEVLSAHIYAQLLDMVVTAVSVEDLIEIVKAPTIREQELILHRCLDKLVGRE